MKLEVQFILLLWCLLHGKSFGCTVSEDGTAVYCSSLNNLPKNKERNVLVTTMHITDSISVIPPSAFSRFPNLVNLTFHSGANIKEINARAFNGLSNLEGLYFDLNKISKIEQNLFANLTNLKFLYLTNNPVKEFRVSGLLESLQQLSLEHCHLKKFDSALTLPNLKVLVLDRNEFEILDKPLAITYKQLLTFRLKGNKITSIYQGYFENLESLELLDLSENKIEYISPRLFRKLTNLNTLLLNSNEIKILSYGTFDTLTNLKTLNLASNEFWSLPQYTLHPLSNLRNLSFEANNISTFNAEDLLEYLPKLEYVWLEENPWYCEGVVHIYDVLTAHGIVLKHFDEDVRNPKCADDRRRTVFDNIFDDSAMKSFFNEEFKKSPFYQFFQKDFDVRPFVRALNRHRKI